MKINHIHTGDCLEILKTFPDNFIDCCVTSPPYFGLRDYGHEGQIGLEETPEAFVGKMVEVFSEVKRVLKQGGTLWLNLGDSYAGSGKGGSEYADTKTNWKQGTSKGSHTKGGKFKSGNGIKPKDQMLIPFEVARALRYDGWYLRDTIIWHKPNPMPESVADRCTKAHEYIFMLSRSRVYYYDSKAIAEATITNDNSIRDRDNTKLNNTPGRTKMMGLKNNNYEYRNKRSVWTITTKPLSKEKKPLSKTRKPTGELEIFKQILSERSRSGRLFSEISGEEIQNPGPGNFHHILPKLQYPAFRLEKKNIIVISDDEHFEIHHGLKSTLLKKPEWKAYFEKVESLKQEYKELKAA